MDKPIYLGFTLLELSNLLMYKTSFHKLQNYLGQDKLQLNWFDSDSFVLIVDTHDIIKHLKNLKHSLTSAIWKKIMEYLVIRTKNYWKN